MSVSMSTHEFTDGGSGALKGKKIVIVRLWSPGPKSRFIIMRDFWIYDIFVYATGSRP